MNTELIIYNNPTDKSTDFYKLDLYDDIAIPVTYAIADFRDPQSRKADFTKTVTIPGTKHNNEVLGHMYEISVDSDFDPRLKREVSVVQDGYEILSGVMELTSVKRDNYYVVEYSVTLYGKIGNIFYNIGDRSIRDLDLSAYDHVFNTSNIRNSWDTSIVKNGAVTNNFTYSAPVNISSFSYEATTDRLQIETSTPHNLAAGDKVWVDVSDDVKSYKGNYTVTAVVDADNVVVNNEFNPGYNTFSSATISKVTVSGEGYVYPMVNYSKSATSQEVWSPEEFRPAVYVKTIVDALFSEANFVYDSDFFDSQYFKRLVMPTNLEAGRTDEQIREASFSAGETTWAGTPQVLVMPNGTPQFSGDLLFTNDSTGSFFDGATNYSTATGEFTAPEESTYAVYSTLNHTLVLTGTPSTSYNIYFSAQHRLLLDGVLVESSVYANTPAVYAFGPAETTKTFTVNTVVSADLNMMPGQKLTVESYYFIGSFTPGTGPISLTPSITYGTFSATPLAYDNPMGNTVQLAAGLPDIKQKDFLTSIINLFNLYMEPTKSQSNKLLIEPRDDFYNSVNPVDWTAKLDISRPIEVNPMGEATAKTYTFAHKLDKDWKNDEYNKKYNEVYGQVKVESVNDFNRSEKKIETLFAATPAVDINNDLGSKIIPWIVKDGSGEKIAALPRLLHYNGLSYVSDNWSMADYSYSQFNNATTLSVLNFLVVSSTLVDVYFSREVDETSAETASNYNVPTIGNATAATLDDDGKKVRLQFSTPFTAGVTYTLNVTNVDDADGNAMTPFSETFQLNLYKSFVYPAANHLDRPQDPTLDLNWGYPNLLYFNSVPGHETKYTNNNLYNRFYSSFIEEITDKDSKVVSAWFALDARDIAELDFKKLYFVDGNALRLQKVTNYNAVQPGLTKCEFLKIKSGVRFTPRDERGYGGIHSSVPRTKKRTLVTTGNNSVVEEVNITNGSFNTIKSNAYNNLVSGDSNIIESDSINNSVTGNNNWLQGGNRNVTIVGDFNVVPAGVSDVVINGSYKTASSTPGGGTQTVVDEVVTELIGTVTAVPVRFIVNDVQAGELSLLGVAFGTDARATDYTVAIGVTAAESNAGDECVAVGWGALENNTKNGTVGVGKNTLRVNTGDNNTALGHVALVSNTTGDDNTGVGQGALNSNTTGRYNTAVGSGCLPGATSNSNTAVGHNSQLSVTTGAQNTSVGRQSMQGNLTGFNNVAVGYQALLTNTGSAGNTAVGVDALGLATGGDNTALGYQAGDFLSSGVANTFLGAYADTSATVTNSTALGANSVVDESNQIVFGPLSTIHYTFRNMQNFADNAAALTGGLVVGDLYYTNTGGDGIVKVVI